MSTIASMSERSGVPVIAADSGGFITRVNDQRSAVPTGMRLASAATIPGASGGPAAARSGKRRGRPQSKA
jgi:hypothetical protein